MYRIIHIPVICFLLVILPGLTGCVSSGVFSSANLTNVELSEANFQIVATNVTGAAEAGYVLGFSAAIGSEMRTFALYRVEGDGLLYSAALENLWQNFETDHGPIGNRRLALVNVRYDADAMNILGFYTKPLIQVRADVVEFQP